MKRSGFTLVELIFVIVIIGVLAAVAVPKYKNLKQNAEVNGMIKTVIDAVQSVPSSYANLVELEGEKTDSNARLDDFISLEGKGWTYAEGASPADDDRGVYTFKPDSSEVATIEFFGTNEANRTVGYSINCDNFADTLSQSKCHDALGTSSGSTKDVNITF